MGCLPHEKSEILTLWIPTHAHYALSYLLLHRAGRRLWLDEWVMPCARADRQIRRCMHTMSGSGLAWPGLTLVAAVSSPRQQFICRHTHTWLMTVTKDWACSCTPSFAWLAGWVGQKSALPGLC